MLNKKKKKRIHKDQMGELFPPTKEEDEERKMSREVRNHVRLGRYREALDQLLPWGFKQMSKEQKIVFVGILNCDLKGGSLIVLPKEGKR